MKQAASAVREKRSSVSVRVKLGLLLSVPMLIAAQSPRQADYSVLTGGNPVGSMHVVRSDSSIAVDYHYSDRGSGPTLHTDISLDGKGLPVELDSTGQNTQHRQIHDQFSRNAGKSVWKTDIDAGSSPAAGYYLPVEVSPEDMAALVRALLEAGDQLPVLPKGQASLRRMTSEAVGDATATLYMVSGIDWAPVPVWLDENRDLVMYNFNRGYLTTIRKGLETYEGKLIAAQTAASTALEQEIAGKLASPRGNIVIRGASLFDAEAKRVVPDQSVVIRGNRIQWVGPSASTPPQPGARVIEASGKFVMPGLWDMHTHFYSDYFGRLLLANGVTSVRDLGATPIDRIVKRRDAYASGQMLGPRITMSGFMDGPGPRAGPTDAIVSTPEQVKSWVDRYADAGVAYIKIYSSVAPALVPVAIAAAKSHGLRVGGHVPDGMQIQDVVRAGFDEVQHAPYWLDPLLPPGTKPPSDPAQSEAYDALVASVDPNSAKADELIDLLVARHTVLDPTLVTFEDEFRDDRGQLPPSLRPFADKLPATVLRRNLSGGGAVSPKDGEYLKQQVRVMLQMLKRMHDAGVTIVPGTDTLVRGFPYVRELELYETAGIPRLDILYMATLGSAKVVKQDGELGSIAAGKLADIVIFDADPTRSIDALRNPAVVIKDGVVLDPQRLLRP